MSHNARQENVAVRRIHTRNLALWIQQQDKSTNTGTYMYTYTHMHAGMHLYIHTCLCKYAANVFQDLALGNSYYLSVPRSHEP